MKALVRMLSGAMVLVLVGCAGPKPPPGWPSGEERPINASHLTKAPR